MKHVLPIVAMVLSFVIYADADCSSSLLKYNVVPVLGLGYSNTSQVCSHRPMPIII
jgi:hypothetical protein